MYHDDLYLDHVTHPFGVDGQPLYATMTRPGRRRMTNWHDLGPNGEYLRSEATKWVYTHPGTDWKIWHLAGAERGREGVALAKELEGIMQPDFEVLYSSGPYMVGEIPERVDWRKREINLGVHVNPNANRERVAEATVWSMRMIEQSWWQSWSETVPGFLGNFTRTHGWRWLRVIHGEPTNTTVSMDPAAHGNNTSLWNIKAHAPWPFYSKKSLAASWSASADQVAVHGGTAHGVIAIANRGTWRAWPKFIVKGAGQATVQDGIGGRQIVLPKLYDHDGAYMLVDTDPTKRTITTERDPIDAQLYKYMRNTQLLSMLLPTVYEAAESKLPAQRRIPGGIGFDQQIPGRTVAHLQVSHDNPDATITAIMPQNYKMPWA